jgi:hypothetical protein
MQGDDLCEVKGCQRLAESSSGGRRFCRTHTLEAGLIPTKAQCEKKGCKKYALLDIHGNRRFCQSHMLLAGLEPRKYPQKLCEAPGCTTRARTESDGSVRYCWKHLLEMGLTPKEYKRKLVEVAKPDTESGRRAKLAKMRR